MKQFNQSCYLFSFLRRMVVILILIFTQSSFPQWKQTNGLYTDWIYSFKEIPDGAGGTRLFACGFNGVFESTDNGIVWKAANNGLPFGLICYSLAFTENSGTVYIFVSASAGIFKSDDYGLNWIISGSNMFNLFNVIAVPNGTGGTNLFTCSLGGGVYRSTTNGASWANVNNGLGSLKVYSLFSCPDNEGGNKIFAGTENHLYVSSNNGSSWTVVNYDLFNPIITFETSPGGEYIFAGTFYNGIFVSTDRGISWESANNGLNSSEIYCLKYSPDGINLYAGVTESDSGKIYLSTNHGFSWTSISNGLSTLRVQGIISSAANLIAGTQGQLFISIDQGLNWIKYNGLQIGHISELINDLSGTFIYASTQGGMYVSSDAGMNWSRISKEKVNCAVVIQGLSSEILFAGTHGNGVLKSTDNGISWTAVNNGIPSFPHVYALTASPNGNGGSNLFGSLWGNGIYCSRDEGNNWTSVNNGLNNYVNSIASSGLNLYAGTQEGLFRSTNEGSSWINLRGGNIFTVESWEDNIFYSGNTGTFLSTDNGSSWINISSNFPDYALSFAVFDSNLFAGTWNGVYHSYDGIIWTEANTGLIKSIPALTVFGTYLIAGTSGSGVWRRPLSEMITSVNEEINIKTYFNLSQNFPNPFNPNTKITFTINEAAHVTIKIFDVLGNEIQTLVNEYKSAGNYDVIWNAYNFPSGVYLYQLRTGFTVETRKMILIR